MLSATSAAFSQTEVLKNVVNNMAFYKQKNDIKFLGKAKASIDSVFKVSPQDTLQLERNVYRAVVNATILYVDSLNKLGMPAGFFNQTTNQVNKLIANRRSDRFQEQMDYVKQCLANVYLRKAFAYVGNSDFNNALQLFELAQSYVPNFKQLNAYIAYSNTKLGNLQAAAKYYTDLIAVDGSKVENIESASSIYKLVGDTVRALEIVKKGRESLPNDRFLLLDEANIYNNKKDYRELEPLLPALLDINTNKADIAFVAANCYDHLDKFDKAESLYLRAIELNSSAYDPIFNLGLLYLRQSEAKKKGDNKEEMAKAVQWLEKANEISPNDVNCLQVLQLVYAKNGDQDQLNSINNKLKLLTN